MEKKQVEASLFSFTKSLVSITLNFILIIVIIGVLGLELRYIGSKLVVKLRKFFYFELMYLFLIHISFPETSEPY